MGQEFSLEKIQQGELGSRELANQNSELKGETKREEKNKSIVLQKVRRVNA